MSEKARAGNCIVFGAFQVDLASEQLRRKGLPVRLPTQSFQVLRALLSHPGELVSRQELQRALWPNDSFGDFEHGLNAAVNRLREALGDSAESPRFIETLPRRGYRFISPIDLHEPAQPSPQAAADHTGEDPAPADAALTSSPVAVSEVHRPTQTRRLGILLALAALAALAVLFAIGGWRYHNARGLVLNAEDNYASVQVSPLTTLPGTELAPTFSPDGSQVAFAWDGGNPDKTSPYDLYVKVIGSERVERLTHHPAEWLVAAWSPDGRNIAFARKGSGMTGIYMISALGGPEHKLTDASFKYDLPMNLSWSSDGQLLAFGTSDGMRELSIADDSVRPIADRPDCKPTYTPAFSPDGQWIAFSCYHDLNYDLEVMPAHGGKAKKLTEVFNEPMPMAWSADSNRILYAELYRLFAINRTGGHPQLLAFAHSPIDPAVSLHGNRLAYADWTMNVNLWRMDLGPGRVGATSLIMATSSEQRAPDISPDGKKIAFESDRSGRHDVWVSNLDGSEPVELGYFRTRTGTPRWSPDGSRIVFDSRETGRASLYLVDPQAGIPRRIDTGNQEAEVPHWSRDGKWIYYNRSANALDSEGIYKVHPDGGSPRLVTASPGFNPQENQSAQILYFMVGVVNGSIHALDLATGKETVVAGMPPVDSATDWVVASKGIYFVDSAAKPATINFYSFASHSVTRRMPLPKPPNFWGGLALSPDESWLAYAQVDRNDSDLMLAEPFR